MGTADAKLAGHMYATPAYMYLWLPILSDAGSKSLLFASREKVYLAGVLRF